jgi:uncharacterized delta-60 repeat protein
MRRHGRQSFCIALSCLGFVLLTATIGWAKAGDLDRSFSKDGKVVTSFPSSGSEAFAVAVQSNGKIVAVGVTGDDEPKMRFALARYNANGSLDRTFSRDGKVMTDLTTGNDVAFAVALLPNGKIVAAGRGRGIGGRFALARYRSTGVLDTTFNHDGKVLTNFSDAEDVAFGVAVQADHKIVAGGTAGGSGGRFALARYTRDGSLDVSFGGDGKLGTNFSPGRDGASDVLIQPDGRIVAAGSADISGGAFALARYNSDGTLDSTFGGSGMVVTDFTPPSPLTSGQDGASGVAIQPDGKIVAVGFAVGEDEEANPADFALARYNPDGTLDGSFGSGGKVRTDVVFGDSLTDVAIQLDGKIVVAGTAETDFTVARYNPDGSLDIGFGEGGFAFTLFPGGFPQAANGVAIQGNGRIVAGGTNDVVDIGSKFAVGRYLAA